MISAFRARGLAVLPLAATIAGCGGSSGPVYGPDGAVKCANSGDCPNQSPLCDATRDTCVQCLHTSDCASGVCDTSSGSCVQCASSNDCTDAKAAVCDTASHTCTTCSAQSDCTHLAATPACDTASGSCVPSCTCANPSPCTSGICNDTTQACFAAAGNLGLCQTCTADADCRPGQLCVPMQFGDPAADVGNFCLWPQDACGTNAPNGDCFNARPFVKPVQVTSVDGINATVCSLAVTTCPGLNDFSTPQPGCGEVDGGVTGPDGGVTGPDGGTGDTACGAPGFDDAFCVMAGPQTQRCTVPCLSSDDCKPGSTCDTTITPNRCTL